MMRLITTCVLAVSLTAAAQQYGPSPWFGTWNLRAQDAGEKPETLVYSDAGNGAMRMESVEARSVIVTRWDGVAVMDSGPTNTTANALAVTAISSTSYSWTFWTEGKPFVQGVNTLADDRQSFTEVSWPIGKPDDKVTLIYERR